MAAAVSILIPTHNRCDILQRTLASACEIHSPPNVSVELIVVANACTDDTVEVVESFISKTPFPIRCVIETVPGLSVARNRAIAESSGEIVAFLDDDIILDREWLVGLLDVFKSQNADIVGGRVVLWWEAIQRPDWMGPELDNLLSMKDHGDQIMELHSGHDAVGANFAFRREIFDRVGGFMAGLGRTGKLLLAGEEGEFLNRALAAGFRMFYAPKASLGHWVPPHRATKSHLAAIAYGRGQSQVFMKEQWGVRQVFRQFIGRSWLIFSGMAGEAAYRLGGNPSRAMVYRAKWMTGAGGLSAVVTRLRGRSPVLVK